MGSALIAERIPEGWHWDDVEIVESVWTTEPACSPPQMAGKKLLSYQELGVFRAQSRDDGEISTLSRTKCVTDVRRMILLEVTLK